MASLVEILVLVYNL